MVRPTGGFVARMLEPGGWPEVDEDSFYDRAQQFTKVLRQTTGVLEATQRQRAQVFDGGVWTGGAADAANGRIGTNVEQLTTLQNAIATVISWHNHIAGTIEHVKSNIHDNLETAHSQIDILQNDTSLDAAERNTAITMVIRAAHGANVGLVAATAEQILATRAWKPPANALEDLLDQRTPPPLPSSDSPDADTPSGGTPSDSTPPGDTPNGDKPTGDTPGGDKPAGDPPDERTPTPGPSPWVPPPLVPPIPNVTPATPVTPTPVPGVPSQPAAGVPAAPVITPSTPATPVKPGSPSSSPGTPAPSAPAVPGAGPAAPLSPAASAGAPSSGADSRGGGVAPASVTSATTPSTPSVRGDDASPPVAPGGAGGMPPASGAPGASRGAGAGSGAGSAAPVGQKPLAPAATGRAASTNTRPTTPSSAATRRDQRADVPDPAQAADVVAMAAIPVSAARAERDAIAAASAADAARRQGSRPDPLRLARRIAAALNAPGAGDQGDLGFFWVTAVTTDGKIVVANSYGLAYIPDGVRLPESVQMASADESIPAAERARWATYPVVAVQGWAAHHHTELRAVIATEAQFANSDAGAAKVVLTVDDIPDSGSMTGRSRLEVVNPGAASRLAATTDMQEFIDLLPPVPADLEESGDEVGPPDLTQILDGPLDLERLLAALPPTPADAKPPVDQRPSLWFEVMKPLTSTVEGREAAHLRAFHAYTAHARDIALKAAHAAVGPDSQGAAAADWFYWKVLTTLLDAALADAP